MCKRILSVLLVIAMLIACLPMAVFADFELTPMSRFWDAFMKDTLNENEYAIAEAAIGTIGARVSDCVGETGETKFTYETVDILCNAIIDYPELSSAFATVGESMIGTIKRAVLNGNIVIGNEETDAYGESLIDVLEMVVDFIINNPDYATVYANGGALLINDIPFYGTTKKIVHEGSDPILVCDFLLDFYNQYSDIVSNSGLDSETLEMLYNLILKSYKEGLGGYLEDISVKIEETDADCELLLKKITENPENAHLILGAYSAWLSARNNFPTYDLRTKTEAVYIDLIDFIAQLPNFGSESMLTNTSMVYAISDFVSKGDTASINYIKNFIEEANKKIRSAESCEKELSLITEATLYFMLKPNVTQEMMQNIYVTWWKVFTDDIIKYPQCASALCVLATDTNFEIDQFFTEIEKMGEGEIPADTSEPFYDAIALYESETIFENYKLADSLMFSNNYQTGGLICAISSLVSRGGEIFDVGNKVLSELYEIVLKAFLEDPEDADIVAHMAENIARGYLINSCSFGEKERTKLNKLYFSVLEEFIADAKKSQGGLSGIVSQTNGYLGIFYRCFMNEKETENIEELYKLGRDVLLENPEASVGLGKIYAALLDAVGECGYRNPESGPFPEDASDSEEALFESEESKPHPFTRLFNGLSEAAAERPEFQIGIGIGGQGAIGATKRCIVNMMEWDGEAGKFVMTRPERYETAELLVDYYFDMLDTLFRIYGKNRVSEIAAMSFGKINAACSDAYGEVLYKNKTLQRIADQIYKKCAKVILDSPESSIAIGIFGQGMIGAIKRICMSPTLSTDEHKDICEHLLDNFDILSKAIEKNYTAQIALGKMGAASMDAIGELLAGSYANKEEYVKDIEIFIDMMIEDAEEIPYASIGLANLYQGVIGAAKRNGMANKPNEALFEAYDFIMGYMKSLNLSQYEPHDFHGGNSGNKDDKTAEEAKTVSQCPKDASCSLTKFNDLVTTEWYHDGIHYCIDNGIMNGVTATEFCPNNMLTRGMVVTVLARMDGVTISSTGVEWYKDGQAWAVKNGISDGTNMTANITREEFATMLYRYAVLKGIDVNKFIQNTNTLSYADVFTISDWATSGMNFCIAAGVIGGDNTGMLNPINNATRAEAAAMFQRLGEKVLAN